MNRLLLLASLLALFGCASSSEELVEASVGEINEQVRVACDCYAELGYAMRSTCEDALGFVGPSRERCVKAAYAGDESASQAHLECVLPLLSEYTSCVNERVTCASISDIEPCNDDYDVGFRGCVELPANVERDINDCFR